MFIAIYSFQVKEGQETSFERAWAELTKLIYQYEGSLGSRLHSKGDNAYVAYAQWPDRKTWENSGSNLPKKANEWRSMMRGACNKIETIFELDSKHDLLKSELF